MSLQTANSKDSVPQKTTTLSEWFFKNIWPIHTEELKKFLPMFGMMILISFIYTILRDMKDPLIMNAPGSGAAALPFIKVAGVTPAAFLLMTLYIKLNHMFSKERVFEIMVSAFMVFIGLFAFIIYPNADMFHPHALIESIRPMVPQGFQQPLSVIEYWTYGLFYISAELWGTFALSVLFWGFANDITQVNQAKRFYAQFALGANIALLFSGAAITFLSSDETGPEAWTYTLRLMTTIILFAGAGILFLHRYMNKSVLTDPRFFDPKLLPSKKGKKAKMSVMESIKYLSKSKYIGYIAILVLAYGITINLVEVTWKHYVKEYCMHDSNLQFKFMGKFSFFTGLTTIFMILFVSSNVLRRFGWKTGAQFTPVMLGITGIIFFGLVVLKEYIHVSDAIMFISPLTGIVIVGAIQNILTKSSKYSLFDPTKEMAYIPLDQELKTNGKAAVDGVGARLGKSGGASINLGLTGLMGSLTSTTPFIAIILFGFVIAWLYAVKKLNIEFLALSKKRDQEREKAEEIAKIAAANATNSASTQSSSTLPSGNPSSAL